VLLRYYSSRPSRAASIRATCHKMESGGLEPLPMSPRRCEFEDLAYLEGRRRFWGP